MPNPDALHIGRINARAIVHLKSWMPVRTAPASVALVVPAGCRLLVLGPGDWMLISDVLGAPALRDYARQVHEQVIAAVGPSPGLAAIQLEGPAARDVLAKSCGLDLHPSSFPVGTCTRTRLAQLPVIVDYIDDRPRFELYVGRSYLSYLCSWLDDAAVGFLDPAQ